MMLPQANVFINANNARGFGGTVVAQNVLRELALQASPFEFEAWIPRVWNWSKGHLGARAKLNPCGPGMAHKWAVENVHLRWALYQRRPNLLFSLSDTSVPGCPIPHLLMVQQAYLSYDPQELDFAMSPSFRARLALMASYFRLGLPTVRHFTVQTEDMKQHLSARWNLAESRISVVPSSIDPRAAQLIEEVANQPQVTDSAPYVCYVASPSAHKNHEILADMMAALPAGLSEVICRLTVHASHVPRLTERAKRLGVLHRFSFEGPVSYGKALQLVRGAAACVMPSKLESFGIPYYEAMALGSPLVVADKGFAREACAQAALYAPAESGEAFGAQLGQILQDSGLSKELSRQGVQRFAQKSWSWSAIAKAYLDLFERVL